MTNNRKIDYKLIIVLTLISVFVSFYLIHKHVPSFQYEPIGLKLFYMVLSLSIIVSIILIVYNLTTPNYFSIVTKRILAAILDIAIVFLPFSKIVEYCSKHNEPYIPFLKYFSFILLISILLLKDCLFKSGSLGKRIFGIAIYDNNTNDYANNITKIKRNLYLLNDFHNDFDKNLKNEFFKNNRRITDIKLNTRIDEIKHDK